MGRVRLVDWCICGPTQRALKTRSRFGAFIRITREFWCLPYVRVFFALKPSCGGIEPIIRTRQEGWCLPDAEFFGKLTQLF